MCPSLLLHLQETDQGLFNADPNFIAVPTGVSVCRAGACMLTGVTGLRLLRLPASPSHPPAGNINLVPTDIRGLTFSRTPQQVLRIVTLGSDTGRGGFFPRGVNGRITSPAVFSDAVNGRGGWLGNLVSVRQGVQGCRHAAQATCSSA